MRTIALIVLLLCNFVQAQHPSILLTRNKLPLVRKGIAQYPLLKQSFAALKKEADKGMAGGLDVPLPADGGGGTSHEKHKKNYQTVLACGILYQITQEERYAKYVKDILLEYTYKYKTWPRHPKRKDEPGGRIFWQNLNDCVWQVYVVQGYDCVYDYLSVADRKKIEEELFVPVVKELMETNTAIFNKIHNHGTWSVAAVGMTGYVCGRKEWVNKALHGVKKDDRGGFLAQLQQLFSPDGYYAEGPYYQRYALLPFILFARTIHQYDPGLKIYQYRNGLLKKAVNTALQCTYTTKAFFPLNDAMKDKTYETEEMVYAADIAYSDMEAGDDLLDIAQQQQRVIVSDAGLAVAKAITEGKTTPFVYKPVWISDGADGRRGGLGILRMGHNDHQTCVVVKAASQGMGHGHFDRLNVLLYDNGSEVFSDYGAVRFLNVESKNGGNYTKENNTWGKQTVAHNTLVVDGRSQYDGEEKKGEEWSPELVDFSVQENYQLVSVKEDHAYPGVALWRTAILFSPSNTSAPILIDVFHVQSNAPHRYELPFWYQGHLTDIPFSVNANTKELPVAGEQAGYQHLWLQASAKTTGNKHYLTFLNNKRFYTTTFLADTAMQVLFVSTGANDPNFNLRHEKAFLLSAPQATNHTFINITEPHGKNNPVAEVTTGAASKVQQLQLLKQEAGIISFSFSYSHQTYQFTIDRNKKSSFLQIQ